MYTVNIMKSVIGRVILGPTCLVGIQIGEVQFVSFKLFPITVGNVVGLKVQPNHGPVEPLLGSIILQSHNIDVASLFLYLVHRARYQFLVDRESATILSILWRRSASMFG